MCQVQAGAYVSLLTPGGTKYSDCHPSKKDIGRQLSLQLRCSYQGQQGDVSLCAETMKPVFEGDNIWHLYWVCMHLCIQVCFCFGFCFFFIPFRIILALLLFSRSLPVVAQIRGHVAGPPLPSSLRYNNAFLLMARIIQRSLPSPTRVELCLPTLLSVLSS